MVMGKKNVKSTLDSLVVRLKQTWMQTYTGQVFEPFEPTEDTINIVDIAHALSNNCRFNGHVQFYYSVAQHSVLISNQLEKEGYPAAILFFGLMHDAAEAYVPDMPTPIKQRLPEFKKLEDLIESVIFKKYGIKKTVSTKKIVKEADIRMLITEARDVMGMQIKPWGVEATPYSNFRIEPQLPLDAEKDFLLRFEQIMLMRK